MQNITAAEILGIRTKQLRQEHQLTQQTFAHSLTHINNLPLTNVQVSRYEAASRTPDPDIIVGVADHFQVTADYLLGRSQQAYEPHMTYFTQEEQFILKVMKDNPDMKKAIYDICTNPQAAQDSFRMISSIVADHMHHIK